MSKRPPDPVVGYLCSREVQLRPDPPPSPCCTMPTYMRTGAILTSIGNISLAKLHHASHQPTQAIILAKIKIPNRLQIPSIMTPKSLVHAP
mmetsp:Transcript_5061/g.7319  ORF Transcript_5061/g.7319 Transcript_5061/m.7319 type:complete len:91 (-) Transcript_5061:519-791(-)